MIDWKTIGNCRPMMTKICEETVKKVFLKAKNGFKKDLPALPQRKFFHVRIVYK